MSTLCMSQCDPPFEKSWLRPWTWFIRQPIINIHRSKHLQIQNTACVGPLFSTNLPRMRNLFQQQQVIKFPTPYEWWSNALPSGQEKASNVWGMRRGMLKLWFDWYIMHQLIEIPAPLFGLEWGSQILDPIKIFIIFQIPAPYFGQILVPKSTLRNAIIRSLENCSSKLTIRVVSIRAGSWRSSPPPLPGFAGYFYCFPSQDMSRRWCLSRPITIYFSQNSGYFKT